MAIIITSATLHFSNERMENGYKRGEDNKPYFQYSKQIIHSIIIVFM